MIVSKWKVYLFSFCIIAFCISIISQANAEIKPLGNLENDYIELNMILNYDGSVSFSQIARSSFNYVDKCTDCRVSASIKIDSRELIDLESIEIEDYNNPDLRFIRVNNLTEWDCIGTYSLNYDTNDIDICLNNSFPNNIAYRLSYKYEPDEDLNKCREKGIVERNLNFKVDSKRLSKILKTSVQVSPDLIPTWPDDKCPFNSTTIKKPNSFECIFSEDNLLLALNGKDAINLEVNLRGKLPEYRANEVQINEGNKRKILETGKSIFIIVLAIFGFFGVYRTRLKNKAYSMLKVA